MHYKELFREENEQMIERFTLSIRRIREIREEETVSPVYREYFCKMADFLLKMADLYELIGSGHAKDLSLDEWKTLNHSLYRDILPEHYEESYANPSYAVKKMGAVFGKILSFLYTEIRGEIIFAFEQRLFDMTIINELFLEIYNLFEQEDVTYRQIKDAVYWYISDYSDEMIMYRTREQMDAGLDFATSLIMDSDLTDLRYLYRYGEYISDNEIRTARFLNTFSEAEIERMAEIYTEGYREGFAINGMDISKKKLVNIRYSIGFERMMRAAVRQFRAMGLEPVIYRYAVHSINKRQMIKIGYGSTSPNKQYEFDHRCDSAIYLDKALINRKLENLRKAYEEYAAEAAVFGGPACLEIFGETPFQPVQKEDVYTYHKGQEQLEVQYRGKANQIVNEYIKPEERSFTIIAYPMPEIGEQYEEIFREIVKVNTLDKDMYREIQQHLIDALDQAKTVHVIGNGENRTNIYVQMHPLEDPEHQTNFENCLADVNIPVGEVFTSPKLAGTHGTLHVSEVFLNELGYKDLCLTFEDGMIKDYTCKNFENEEDNQKYVKENVLYNRDTLPIGEFAIGTNTTAYVMAHKYDIVYKLPILIAEKMGPHFAVGDTCYSYCEETIVHNPDGKEIIAKDNECSILRKTDPENAYFNCHTDITIPYEELGSITAIRADGTEISLIRDGRFVLPGTEKLNEAFQ
ncbi:MAG TPA: aminopeptidase [Candidatus Fimousia stercorigallinarum]|nr:aminopeptidase [Candidatus Fimousia stercorigallinarum]